MKANSTDYQRSGFQICWWWKDEDEDAVLGSSPYTTPFQLHRVSSMNYHKGTGSLALTSPGIKTVLTKCDCCVLADSSLQLIARKAGGKDVDEIAALGCTMAKVADVLLSAAAGLLSAPNAQQVGSASCGAGWSGPFGEGQGGKGFPSLPWGLFCPRWVQNRPDSAAECSSRATVSTQ
jgi:hypothetical protein